MDSLGQKKVISMLYEVKDANTDSIIDSNINAKPFEFLLGAGQVIAGLERAVANAKQGDVLHVSIAPEDAYGVYRSDLIQEVPIEQFEGIVLEKNMTLFGQAEDGQTVQVIIKDFNDKSVMIDYNHKLAGKTLEFNVEIVGIREASEEEIARGYVGGGCCGGSCGTHEEQHEEGSCCGGGGGCGCH